MAEKKEIVWSKFSLEEIRQYYYNKNISELIFEAQKYEDITQESIGVLTNILHDIRTKEVSTIDLLKNEFKDYIEQENVKVDNISMSDDELLKFKAEVAKAKSEIDFIVNQIQEYVRKEKDDKGFTQKLSKDDLLDRALIINHSITTIKKFKLYWDNKYHKKIIDTMKDLRITRKTAEDYAQFSREYQNYKQAGFDLEEYEEMILLIKKKTSNEY